MEVGNGQTTKDSRRFLTRSLIARLSSIVNMAQTGQVSYAVSFICPLLSCYGNCGLSEKVYVYTFIKGLMKDMTSCFIFFNVIVLPHGR